MEAKTKEFSFCKGWSQVRLMDKKEAKSKIMKALNVTTDLSWRNRRDGNIIPKVPEARAIEKIFAEYGITEVWGAKL